MYCPSCGCVTFGEDCEWCGPATLYKDKGNYCEDCGGKKEEARGKDTT